MTEELKKQIDFFISNMGYEEKDSLEDAITEAITSAYGTAKRTYKGVKNSNEAIAEFQKKVIEYFKSNNFPKTQEEFNKEHKKLCNKWIKILADKNNEGDNLSYGKAQKVVNMMFKYMYCYSYKNDFQEIPEEAFKFCHMTLDSFTLRWIHEWDEKVRKNTSWSKLDPNEYEKISEIVEANENKLNGYTKFEAEFFIWYYEQLQSLIESLKKVRKSYEEHKNQNLNTIASKTKVYIKDLEEISKQLITF